jgi:hypothetical protein
MLVGLAFLTVPYIDKLAPEPSLAKTILLSVDAPGKVKFRCDVF